MKRAAAALMLALALAGDTRLAGLAQLTEIALPDQAGTLYERPSDKARLVSYLLDEHPAGAYPMTRGYARRGRTFTRVSGTGYSVSVSPNGEQLAMVDELWFKRQSRPEVRFTDRASGESFRVPVRLRDGQAMKDPIWARKGDRLLLTVADSSGGRGSQNVGYVIVHVPSRQASFIQLYEVGPTGVLLDTLERFRWGPRDESVAAAGERGLTLLALDGTILRRLSWVGTARDFGWFSPAGDRFYTTFCLSEYSHEAILYSECVWDTATGRRLATVYGAYQGDTVLGWWDEDHFIVGRPHGGSYWVVVKDFSGRQTQMLAKFKAGEENGRVFRFAFGHPDTGG
ncbi:hypothetical protein ACIBI9_56315 [Nonomuraea sp. NPDC050451]|uniref:hypothetical protein n=1 Tax=Nonomuraea sp. NPDC050451 TaxID=3364364 RepID=UPI0037BCC387